MDEQQLKDIITKNLIYYRRLNHFTQSEIADKLNYSDKSVSKWERGEGTPDVFVLQQLAEIYGITLNDLISPVQKKKRWNPREHHLLIALLSGGLVWMLAVIVFSALKIFMPSFEYSAITFVYALAVCATVLVVLTAVWKNRFICCICISVLIWSLAGALYCTIAIPMFWLIFIVAIPIQVLTVLWFVYRRYKRKSQGGTSK